MNTHFNPLQLRTHADPRSTLRLDGWELQRALMKFGIATDIVYWHEKLVAVTKEIDQLKGPKRAEKVFVTFEKEVSQRECLKIMTTGALQESCVA